MIVVKNLSKQYIQGEKSIQALQPLSFTLESKKSMAITGPSGCGKTTLLSLIAGLENPTTGFVEIIGQNISSMSEKEKSQFRSQNIGIVFQQFHLMPHLTALENVCLPLEILKQKDVQDKALQALKEVGLEDRAHHLPHALSGGESQRVAIARAIVARPKLLLADEPSGNLDVETGKKIMNLMFDIQNNFGLTFILVTHDSSLAKRCDVVSNLG